MPKYYLLDEHKNMVEGFDKEGFLALLEQAIEDGSLENIDEDSAVASKFRSVLNGTTHHIEFVTQAQYNQLVASGQLVPNTYYFITDDATAEGLEQAVAHNAQDIEDIVSGDTAVGHATKADETDFTNAMFTSVSFNHAQVTLTDPLETGFYFFKYHSDDNKNISIGIVYNQISTLETIYSPAFVAKDNQDMGFYHNCRLKIVNSTNLGGAITTKLNIEQVGFDGGDTPSSLADNGTIFFKKID